MFTRCRKNYELKPSYFVYSYSLSCRWPDQPLIDKCMAELCLFLIFSIFALLNLFSWFWYTVSIYIYEIDINWVPFISADGNGKNAKTYKELCKSLCKLADVDRCTLQFWLSKMIVIAKVCWSSG